MRAEAGSPLGDCCYLGGGHPAPCAAPHRGLAGRQQSTQRKERQAAQASDHLGGPGPAPGHLCTPGPSLGSPTSACFCSDHRVLPSFLPLLSLDLGVLRGRSPPGSSQAAWTGPGVSPWCVAPEVVPCRWAGGRGGSPELSPGLERRSGGTVAWTERGSGCLRPSRLSYLEYLPRRGKWRQDPSCHF